MARLDELERKFEENPRRYFAPLANEYRKAGDPQRAADLCRAQLPEIPGHISGHIVLGQALYDSGDFEGARSALETALALDPENIVALRYLGDIARDTGDLQGAEHWYSRTLDADPYNEAATAALQSIRDAAPTAEAAKPIAEVPETVSDVSPAASGDETAPFVEPEPILAALDSVAERVSETDMAAASVTDAASEMQKIRAEGLDTTSEADVAATPVLAESAEQEVAGATGTEAATAETLPDPQEFAGDLEISAAAERAEATETVVDEPSAEEAPATIGSSEPAAAAEASEQQPSEEVFQPAVPAADPPAAEPADVAAHALPEPITVEELMQTEERVMESAAPFVTETMADLYLEQGYPHEALELLLQLSEQRPQDESLRVKIEHIESVIVARRDAAVAAARAERAEAAETAEVVEVAAPAEEEPVPATAAPFDPAGAEIDASALESPLEPVRAAPRSVREMFARMDSARPRSASAVTARPLARLRSDFVALPDAEGAQSGLSDDPFGFPDAQPAASQQPSAVSRTSGPQPRFDPSTAEIADFDAWLRGLRGP